MYIDDIMIFVKNGKNEQLIFKLLESIIEMLQWNLGLKNVP